MPDVISAIEGERSAQLLLESNWNTWFDFVVYEFMPNWYRISCRPTIYEVVIESPASGSDVVACLPVDLRQLMAQWTLDYHNCGP